MPKPAPQPERACENAWTAERGLAYDGPLQKVSVVVPVYFNAETLPTLIERLRVPSSGEF